MNGSIPHMETIKATAKLLNIPENFVRQKVLSGEVVAVMAGRKYLVNVDRFVEFLNSNTIKANTAETHGITPIPARL